MIMPLIQNVWRQAFCIFVGIDVLNFYKRLIYIG